MHKEDDTLHGTCGKTTFYETFFKQVRMHIRRYQETDQKDLSSFSTVITPG